MIQHLNVAWQNILKETIEAPYFSELSTAIVQEYEAHTCYPPKEEIFASLNLLPFEKVKVVLIGQDPYHGQGQANGLAFSVTKGQVVPPSLRNIHKELVDDLNVKASLSGDLTAWAKEGVLLLNTTLTVREGQAASHKGLGWQKFTDSIIQLLSAQKESLVFLLWGGHAHKKAKYINADTHLILQAGHPSPLSANRGYWFGNKCFSKTNAYLKSKNNTPIHWENILDSSGKLF